MTFVQFANPNQAHAVMRRKTFLMCAALLIAVLTLTSCGGGGGGTTLGSSGNTTYTAGVFNASSTYAGRCAAPRSGTDPQTGKAFVDVAGSTTLENFWLRSWTHAFYLWYSEVPDLNPANYASPANDYFPLLMTSAITPSGNPKDKFHFTYKTSDWVALSQSGVSAGYGVEWALVSASPPRVAVVAYTEPGSPATNNNLTRGEEVITVDGVDVANGSDVDTLNNGLFPTATGQAHTFVLQDLNGMQHTVTMTSISVTSTPVQNVGTVAGTSGAVGYMLFNDHLATAEQELINAFTTLRNSNVSDLVLDIRYNGGGYLDIASEVGYMIAGATKTNGKTFEHATFNTQYATNIDPIAGGANDPTPFHSTAVGFSATAGQALPTLNLSRVFILTGPGTCSASEAIINSLRGVNVQVIQIGSTTCGKPYGFYPQDNCGTTYFSIEFKGVNDAGFGDYPDGFSPANSSPANMGVAVPGCSVLDDFTHALGDPAESRLAAALFYRNALNTSSSAVCAAGPSGFSPGHMQIQSTNEPVADLSAVDGALYKGPWRENRILAKQQ